MLAKTIGDKINKRNKIAYRGWVKRAGILLSSGLDKWKRKLRGFPQGVRLPVRVITEDRLWHINAVTRTKDSWRCTSPTVIYL